MENNVVFSKISSEYIPVVVKPKIYNATESWPKMIEYNVYDNYKKVGFVHLLDSDYGCYVQRIENNNPTEYGKFGYLADKLEIQYCLDKGMKNFEVRSNAAMNSHALHYIRGKRFEGCANAAKINRFKEIYNDADIKSFRYNTIVKYIIDHTPKGERFNTMFLRTIPMYMPNTLIQKYVAELLKNPIVFK